MEIITVQLSSHIQQYDPPSAGRQTKDQYYTAAHMQMSAKTYNYDSKGLYNMLERKLNFVLARLDRDATETKNYYAKCDKSKWKYLQSATPTNYVSKRSLSENHSNLSTISVVDESKTSMRHMRIRPIGHTS